MVRARPPRPHLLPAAGRAVTARGGASAVGAIREFGEALSSGPFRVALALSALAHLALLLGLRGGDAKPRSRPPVRVHFVREAPAPAVEASPGGRPARREERALTDR